MRYQDLGEALVLAMDIMRATASLEGGDDLHEISLAIPRRLASASRRHRAEDRATDVRRAVASTECFRKLADALVEVGAIEVGQYAEICGSNAKLLAILARSV